jgi:phenylacetate-coenzyme A ligase PaaK-like adenylate-forming protein
LLPERILKKIQLKRFENLFEWAKENSAFYRKIYAEAGVLDLRIKGPEDIEKIPMVNKEMMLTHQTDFVLTRSMTEDLVVTSSSGSTGKPFDVYLNRKEHFTSYVRTFLALKGYNPFKEFVLIGLSEQKENIEKKSFLYYSQKYLGVFRREKYSVLTPFDEIALSLRDREIGVLSSTSSCFQLLIEELKKTKEKLSVKYAVVSGETLIDDCGAI